MSFIARKNTMPSNKEASLQEEMFRELLRIRLIEEAIVEKYPEQEMRCPTHFSIGQEAVAVGICANLKKEDYVFSAHRAHAHYLAKGGSLPKFISELYGKSTGCAGGRGGSMHLVDIDAGFLGAVPIVGSTIPLAVGVAFETKRKNEDAITAVFFGDGATEEGVFYESLNFAKFHSLPILFVCENNLYSVNTHYQDRRVSSQKIIDIAKSFGIETAMGDGQDCDEVYNLSHRLIKEVRQGQGPKFLELNTYLYIEHCGPNPVTRPTTQEETEFWVQKEPLENYRKKLFSEGVLNQISVDSYTQEIKNEILEAFSFAKQSPYPNREDLVKNIFKDN